MHWNKTYVSSYLHEKMFEVRIHITLCDFMLEEIQQILVKLF